MPQFVVNPHRFDPYKNFKFRVKWDGKYVAGVSKISALKGPPYPSRIGMVTIPAVRVYRPEPGSLNRLPLSAE